MSHYCCRKCDQRYEYCKCNSSYKPPWNTNKEFKEWVYKQLQELKLKRKG